MIGLLSDVKSKTEVCRLSTDDTKYRNTASIILTSQNIQDILICLKWSKQIYSVSVSTLSTSQEMLVWNSPICLSSLSSPSTAQSGALLLVDIHRDTELWLVEPYYYLNYKTSVSTELLYKALRSGLSPLVVLKYPNMLHVRHCLLVFGNLRCLIKTYKVDKMGLIGGIESFFKNNMFSDEIS